MGEFIEGPAELRVNSAPTREFLPLPNSDVDEPGIFATSIADEQSMLAQLPKVARHTHGRRGSPIGFYGISGVERLLRKVSG